MHYEERPWLLTTKEAAEITGLTRNTIQRLCREGKLRHVEVGREFRLTMEGLEAWKRENEKGGE